MNKPMNDRDTLLALSLDEKEIICNARTAAQQLSSHAYGRMPSILFTAITACCMLWAAQSELFAMLMPQVLGFDTRIGLTAFGWIGIIVSCLMFGFELRIIRKENNDRLNTIEMAQKLGADVTSMDDWILKQILSEVEKKYKRKPVEVPAEFEGQEWKYRFDPDFYKRDTSNLYDWMIFTADRNKVFEKNFELIRKGDTIDPERLRSELNRSPFKSIKTGLTLFVSSFLISSIGTELNIWLIKGISVICILAAQVFIFRSFAYTKRSESIRYSGYSDTIVSWSKYHPEVHAFAARNGLYTACSEIEFGLIRHYVQLKRIEIFNSEQGACSAG
jgi:hypothetical protein